MGPQNGIRRPNQNRTSTTNRAGVWTGRHILWQCRAHTLHNLLCLVDVCAAHATTTSAASRMTTHATSVSAAVVGAACVCAKHVHVVLVLEAICGEVMRRRFVVGHAVTQSRKTCALMAAESASSVRSAVLQQS